MVNAHVHREAWAQDPAARPTFLQINERLNAILIEVACQDEFARHYWRHFFPNLVSLFHYTKFVNSFCSWAAQDKVSWRDFVEKFHQFSNLPLIMDDMQSLRNLSSDPLPDNPSPQQLHRAKVRLQRLVKKHTNIHIPSDINFLYFWRCRLRSSRSS